MDTANIKKLFKDFTGKEAKIFLPLPPAGSERKYYRLGTDDGFSAIGAFNADITENKAFLYLSLHFRSKLISVPEIYRVSDDNMYYLMEDFGDIRLKDIVDENTRNGEFPANLIALYKRVLDNLIKFQVQGHEDLDYSVCYPRDSFDKRSILWDLNHFKYFFLKLSHIPYNENLLENDFQLLATNLDKISRSFFMFRDFQSRNIMVKNDELYFIDYQGGRKGALQYDLASLLFESRTNIPPEVRKELFRYYYDELLRLKIVNNNDSESFQRDFMSFALIRQLQAMGAYGLRGWIEGKPLFIQSIAYAVVNLEWILIDSSKSFDIYPEMLRVLTEITKNKKLRDKKEFNQEELVVRIYSFSYFRGIPDDFSGNGGGYVFDCRHILNPGSYPEFKYLTGLDKETETFFTENTTMHSFLNNVFPIIEMTVKRYLERDFKNLQVCFGCTGGQHRSVYAAQKLFEHLQSTGTKAKIEHLELNELNR